VTEQTRKRLAKGKSLGGAPRTKTPVTWTPEQLKYIDDMAEAQCKDTTIAESLGCDVKTFQDQFSKRTREKRAQGKLKMLDAQYHKAVVDHDTTMLIWTGKQHLEQSDRQDIKHSGEVTISPPLIK
jgi:hypothetical protein